MWPAMRSSQCREQSKQTRLGHGFYETHRLRTEAIAATAKAVADFAAMAREAQAVSIRVIATSAAREAVNREELTAAIEQASGLKVEVISGEQEAEWGFQGVTTDPQLARAPLLLMDVGGGSTQFVFGRDGRALCRHSFPLGHRCGCWRPFPAATRPNRPNWPPAASG